MQRVIKLTKLVASHRSSPTVLSLTAFVLERILEKLDRSR